MSENIKRQWNTPQSLSEKYIQQVHANRELVDRLKNYKLLLRRSRSKVINCLTNRYQKELSEKLNLGIFKPLDNDAKHNVKLKNQRDLIKTLIDSNAQLTIDLHVKTYEYENLKNKMTLAVNELLSNPLISNLDSKKIMSDFLANLDNHENNTTQV